MHFTSGLWLDHVEVFIRLLLRKSCQTDPPFHSWHKMTVLETT